MYPEPKYHPEFIEKIAQDLVFKSLRIQKGEILLLNFDPPAAQLAHRVAELVLNQEAYVDWLVTDTILDNMNKALAPLPFLKQPNAAYLNRLQRCDCYLRISADENESLLPVPAEHRHWLNLAQAAERDEIVDEERTRRCVLYLPTNKQAKRDNMSFAEYCQIYFQACDLPWTEIAAAQERLAAKFTAADTIEIVADPHNPNPKKRTNLTMSVKGMSFINSHILKNYPGAEIFSAPLLNSTNGTFYSPGRFFRGDAIIRDIYLQFANGKVIDFDATEGRDILEKTIATDAGSCYVGEIGIGTNPKLIADVSDSLLFEKKGGSFHLALGSPYKIRIYDGKPVRVDNGGNSSLHWDITQMLIHRHGSHIRLDGKTVQENGSWLDAELHILNPKI